MRTSRNAVFGAIWVPESGLEVFTPNGGLFTACNEERLNEYKRLKTVGEFYGIESSVLRGQEIADVYPLIGLDDLCGALSRLLQGV